LVGTGGNKSGKKKKQTAESVNLRLKLVALIAVLGLIWFIKMVFPMANNYKKRW
jgi:hypothetical protein